LNARLEVKYVGDAACARCHSDIAETFRRHPMGRSLTPISAAPPFGFDKTEGTTTFGAGSYRFTVERRGGREFHRETFRDGEKVLAEVEAEVTYALGSGKRGIAYLVEHDGRLYQSPITWYGQKQRFDLSPGYELANAHFNRPIEPICLFCHANRALPVALTVNRYEEQVFHESAIGCERCHGPGELHVRGQKLVDGRDLTIVNPRHLEPALRANVCEQCHLVGDLRVDRAGRDTFDFRPGLPLTEFFAVFGHADEEGHKAVGHVEQMKLSRCFRASDGKLGCTSCHDPHQVPAPEERISYFRDQCLACHARNGCSLPAKDRLAQSREDDCVKCHMTLFASADIVHTATTDHRILRKPGSMPAKPHRPRPEFPLVLLNDDAMSRPKRQPLERELAIALATEASQPAIAQELRATSVRVLSMLDRAIVERPDDLIAQRMKAQVLRLTGHSDQAQFLLESVLKVAPSYEQALDEYVPCVIGRGDLKAALEPAQRSVDLNPWSAPFHERLAHVYLESVDWNGAVHEAREALRLDPFRRFARMFLVQCLLHSQDNKAAGDEFATLIKLDAGRRETLERWFAIQKQSASVP
jgi:Cytochrome c554 and c-prime